MDGSMVSPAPTRERILPQWSEVGWTRAVACVAVILLTVALASLNVSGAWIASGGNLFYTAVICGVEILAATTLVLILAAPTWPRKIVGGITMAALIYVAVENGKMAVTESFKTIFKDDAGHLLSPTALRLKAKLADTDPEKVKAASLTERAAIADEIAALKVEQGLMRSDTPPGIRAAQLSLKANGAYTGPIDGKRAKLTEDAMLLRGEQIRKRLDVLSAKGGGNLESSADAAAQAIDNNAKADEIDGRKVWLYMLLIGCEMARTAGLWAFVIWTSHKQKIPVDAGAFADLLRAAAELEKRVNNINAGVDKRRKTNNKKEKVKANLLAIEHDQAKVDRTSTPLHEDVHPEAGEETQTPAQIDAATDAESDGEVDLSDDEEEDEQRPLQAAE